MKKFVMISVLLAMAAGVCFAADPCEGYWIRWDKKAGENAGWEFYVENGQLMGKIISAAKCTPATKADKCKASYKDFPLPGKVNEMPMIGTPWIYGLTKKAPGEWVQGYIVDSSKGDLYKSKITFHAADGKKYKVDTLEMRGEIGMGIGRSEFWTKATKEEAGAFK